MVRQQAHAGASHQFVGGKLLVEAVTQNDHAQPVLGNYPDAVLLPEKA